MFSEYYTFVQYFIVHVAPTTFLSFCYHLRRQDRKFQSRWSNLKHQESDSGTWDPVP